MSLSRRRDAVPLLLVAGGVVQVRLRVLARVRRSRGDDAGLERSLRSLTADRERTTHGDAAVHDDPPRLAALPGRVAARTDGSELPVRGDAQAAKDLGAP